MARYMAYEIELKHDALHKYRVIRGSGRYEVEQRASALRQQWSEEWGRRQGVERRRALQLQISNSKQAMKDQAAEQTLAAAAHLDALNSILVECLAEPVPFRWEQLRDSAQFAERRPIERAKLPYPKALDEASFWYQPKVGLLEWILPSRKAAAIARAKQFYSDDLAKWRGESERIDLDNAKAKVQFEADDLAWKKRKEDFERQKAEQHASVDAREAAVLAGDEAAVDEYLDLVLGSLKFPEGINGNFVVEYSAVTKSCVIDFDLPNPDDLPRLREVRYVASREEFTEKLSSEAEHSRLYDAVLYQIALRALISVFSADTSGHLLWATLNGWVDYVDRATGMDERSCILTLSVGRDDFARIDFERVDPKECFRSLKGVSASKLIGLAPVAPLERPKIVDKRFIESHEVAANINVGVNLAAMDWQEFEHLVRQVFEHQFSTPGSEVHVTQASRDGGVDAIVHDPDPIKGGKIVIQAKRYTNTVEVSAVRDLYGTVVNEGATKGILVTTSQFGPDARKFALSKPIVLIDGSNLLSLLEQMGVQARIDLKEAKSLLANQV